MDKAAAIFLDGGYLQKVMADEFGSPKIDFSKLALKMAEPEELLRAYYYNCLPWQSSNPTVEDRDRYARARRFVAALESLPRFEIRLGRIAHRGIDQSGKPIFAQKRVDIMLGVDLVLLAAKARISKAAIFTGDSDFIPAIKAAKNEGVNVHLFHGNRAHVHEEIWMAADDRTQLDAAFVDALRMPDRRH